MGPGLVDAVGCGAMDSLFSLIFGRSKWPHLISTIMSNNNNKSSEVNSVNSRLHFSKPKYTNYGVHSCSWIRTSMSPFGLSPCAPCDTKLVVMLFARCFSSYSLTKGRLFRLNFSEGKAAIQISAFPGIKNGVAAKLTSFTKKTDSLVELFTQHLPTLCACHYRYGCTHTFCDRRTRSEHGQRTGAKRANI